MNLYCADDDKGHMIAYKVERKDLPAKYKRLYILRDPKPEGWFGPWEEIANEGIQTASQGV